MIWSFKIAIVETLCLDHTKPKNIAIVLKQIYWNFRLHPLFFFTRIVSILPWSKYESLIGFPFNLNLKDMQLFYRQQLICHIKDPQITNQFSLKWYLNDTIFDSNISPLSIFNRQTYQNSGMYLNHINILRIRFAYHENNMRHWDLLCQDTIIGVGLRLVLSSYVKVFSKNLTRARTL